MTEPRARTADIEIEATHPVTDPDAALTRRNLQFGWALVGLVVLLFAGTVGVAFVYLWLS